MPIETYQDLKHNPYTGTEGIPKLIFRAGPFRLKDLPADIRRIYKQTLKMNPGYRLIYFDHRDQRRMIKEQCPKEYLDCFDALKPRAYKADFWRYVTLLHYGGCYGDFSQQLLVTYDSLCKGVEQVLCKEIEDVTHGMYNAFICTVKDSPLIKRTLDVCIFNIRNRMSRSNVLLLLEDHCSLAVTGPVVYGLAYLYTSHLLGKTKFIKIISKTDLYIRDARNTRRKIAIRKHPDHFKILYDNRKQKHYGYYWEKDDIYNN